MSIVLRGFDSYVFRNPVLFSVGFGATKNVIADMLVQKYAEGRNTIDWRRVGTFGSFGAVWVGAGQVRVDFIIRPKFTRARRTVPC